MQMFLQFSEIQPTFDLQELVYNKCKPSETTRILTRCFPKHSSTAVREELKVVPFSLPITSSIRPSDQKTSVLWRKVTKYLERKRKFISFASL